MNKTKAINRLFLCTIIWVLGTSVYIGWLPFTGNLTMEQLMLLSQILYLIPVLVFMIKNRTTPAEWMPFRRLKLSVIVMTMLYTLLLLPLVTLLNLISMLFVENVVAASQAKLASNPIWMNLLLVAGVPALFEEFAFRGFYYHGYRQRGVWCAILGSAFAFGLMHMNFNQFGYACALGIAFGLLLEATGSIFATMLAHFTINSWSVIMTAVTQSSGEVTTAAKTALPFEIMAAAISVYIVLAAVGTCLAGVVLIWIAKRCGRLEHLKWCFRRRERKPGQPRTIVTPAFIAALVIVVVYMVFIA